MTWFKVDDGFAFHPKAIMAGNSALGLWVRAGAWCGANLTDGALPKYMIGTLGAQARDAKKLVEVGLWVETADGYQFHEWVAMQPTKASVLKEREKNRKRQQEWKERQANGATNTVSDDVTNEVPSRPVPSRPEEAKASSSSLTLVPGGSPEEAKKPETKIPRDWAPTASHIERARAKGVDVLAQAEAFKLHAETHDRRAASWNAAFTSWLIKSKPTLSLASPSSPWSKEFHQ